MKNLNLDVMLKTIRHDHPLIHNITNYVVMNFTANTLLAMGASPVMAHAPNEVEEMVSLAKALVINIGTLSDHWIDSMIKAGKKANQLAVPIILDPVGSGATSLRTNTFKKLAKELDISIIRGNASEILSIASDDIKTKGVDTAHNVDQATETAMKEAHQLNSIVVITGPIDLITDGKSIIRCSNGHPLLSSITGTGCASTATIAAFAAVSVNMMFAAAAGLAFFGMAGEIAAEKAKSPGSFMAALIDAMYEITPEQFADMAKLELC